MRKTLFTALGAAALFLSGGPAFASNGLGIEGSMHDRSEGGGAHIPGVGHDHYAACTGHTAPPVSAGTIDPVTGELVGVVHAITTQKQCVDNGGTWDARVPPDGYAQGEVCRICHSPHDYAQDYYKAGLLWNRQLNESEYMMYSPNSASIGGSDPAGVSRVAGGPSKLCLSCHDGTIAVDVRYGISNRFISTKRQISTKRTDTGQIDLRGTHPISIDYPLTDPVAGRAGGGFNDLTTPVGSVISFDPTYTANTSTVAAVSSGTISDVLYSGKVECSSCHDVHNSEGVAVPFSPLLRVAQNERSQGGDRASGLCLTCHDK